MKLEKINSKNQETLFGYDDLFLKIVSLYEKNKLPNKILFSGLKGIGKATFSYHLINYILSKNEELPYNIKKFQINPLNRSFNLVKNNSHPNFHLINIMEDKNFIEINQIRQMINYSNKSAFNNKLRIILIDNADKLNLNSSNSLLKIVEEPNDNILFILILDNTKKILETLKSRCIKFNFSLSSNKCVEISNKVINNNVENFLNKDLTNHYNTISDYINLIKFANSSKLNMVETNLKDFLINLIDGKFYKKNQYIKENISKFAESYLLKLLNLNQSDKKIPLLYENHIKKNFHLKKFNLDEESFFIELKSKVLNV